MNESSLDKWDSRSDWRKQPKLEKLSARVPGATSSSAKRRSMAI